MALHLKPEDRLAVREISNILRKNRRFLITTHYNIDGDAIGSQLALYMFLDNDPEKEVVIVNQDRVPSAYRFLPRSRLVVTPGAGIPFKPDVSIVLDCGSPGRTGSVLELIRQASVVVNIDHHFSNAGHGTVNWVNHEFSATGEMIYFIIAESGTLTKKQAVCLYAAIMTDTGKFMHNIGPHTMSVVKLLLDRGIAPEAIASKVYMERPYRSFLLLRMALNGMVFDREKKACWMKVTRQMYRDTKTSEEDTEGFIDLLTSIKEARVVFLLKEYVHGGRKDSTGGVKVSLRCRAGFDVEKIAGKFGGGGHRQAAGCRFDNVSIEEAESLILDEIDRVVNSGVRVLNNPKNFGT